MTDRLTAPTPRRPTTRRAGSYPSSAAFWRTDAASPKDCLLRALGRYWMMSSAVGLRCLSQECRVRARPGRPLRHAGRPGLFVEPEGFGGGSTEVGRRPEEEKL
jgi:hypothetical protein